MAEKSASAWQAQKPCPECGERPGRNPTTGVEVKDGHKYNCKRKDMSPAQRAAAERAEDVAEANRERDAAVAERDALAAEKRQERDEATGEADQEKAAAVAAKTAKLK